jgi:DNA polymerase-3 subunit epsilon
VHGLTQAFLADKPLFSHIAEDFLRFIDGAQLIIHNAPFDIGFLEAELNLAAKTHQSITEYCTVLDTLPLARQLHPRQRNSLDALCKRYSIDNSHRELHGALLDAELLARVYLAMTGGQSSLFDETILAQPVMHKINQQQVLSIEKSLVVRYADEEELSAHQAYLEKILQKNKSHCLWLQHYPHTQTVEEIS